MRVQLWGLSDDRLVVSDYDGDGRTDVAVFRSSTNAWYILQSGTNSLAASNWGANGDLPVLAAYVP
ncbi:MAG: FG-GAP-like repeat-containing protein [Pyrinomonadaceae bacterium]